MNENTCFPIIGHEWSKWSEATEPYDGTRQQWRYCLRCNKITYRNIGYANGAYVEIINKVISKLKGLKNE